MGLSSVSSASSSDDKDVSFFFLDSEIRNFFSVAEPPSKYSNLDTVLAAMEVSCLVLSAFLSETEPLSECPSLIPVPIVEVSFPVITANGFLVDVISAMEVSLLMVAVSGIFSKLELLLSELELDATADLGFSLLVVSAAAGVFELVHEALQLSEYSDFAMISERHKI